MTTARQAIREEIREIDHRAKEFGEKIAELKFKREKLSQALDALSGRTAADPPRQRISRGRISMDVRETQVLDTIRGDRDREWNAQQMAGLEFDGSPPLGATSARAAIERLLAEGKVTKVGETPRGAPIVRYRDATIRPGEEVK